MRLGVSIYIHLTYRTEGLHALGGYFCSYFIERVKPFCAIFFVAGKHCGGIQDLLYESLMACDIDTRRDLANNLIFAGSTTEFPGFVDRLQKEIDSLIPSTLRARVSKYCYSKYSVWIGGSILASLSTFQQLWITRQEYDETGPSIVHRIS